MDFMTLIGLLAGITTVYYVMAAGGILHLLFNPLAIVLVFGGTFSATFIAYPLETLRRMPKALRLMFMRQDYTDKVRVETIESLASLAEKSRRHGAGSLQTDASAQRDKFLSLGIQMVVDGLELDSISENMEKKMAFSYQHNQKVSSVFRTMATLSPIFGLLGTLIGVVQVLKNLNSPTEMGAAMAIAITTTFYGIFAANFVFLPAAIKLGDRNEDEALYRKLIMEGILAIREGQLPVILRKRLNSFIMSKKGLETKAQ
jgi:chemotaxis protein MotA